MTDATKGKTLAELVATEGLKLNDVLRCDWSCDADINFGDRGSINEYGRLEICGLELAPGYDRACFTIVSRAAQPVYPVNLDEGGKADDWPWASVTVECVDEDGTGTEITVRQSGAVILECDGFSLHFLPGEARALAEALTRYADLAALEARILAALQVKEGRE